jgi:hypothetical protein
VTTTAEHVARSRKAQALADAFAHLAAPATDVPAAPDEVLAFATAADDATWRRAEVLGGTRPASTMTRGATLALLGRLVAFGPYEPPQPADPLAGF